MHIWLVNHYALPPTEPGGSRHYALARELIRRGHQVTIFASNVNHATGRCIRAAKRRTVTVTEFDCVRFVFLPVPRYHGRLVRLWNMVVFALQVWCGVGARTVEKPTVVVGSSLTLFAALAALRIARRAGVPFVLEIRDLWPQTLIHMGVSPRHPAVLVFGMIEGYLYRHATKIVTLLPNSTEYIMARGGEQEDITWIPNGVDLAIVRTSPARANGIFTVMYAGSHGLSDALDPVLDAARILHRRAPGHFRFRFLGDGPAKRGMQRRVHRESIQNVTFEEPVARSEVFSKLLEADGFILSLKKTDLYRYGISPNKLHEYMAAGRPTIVAGYAERNPVAEAAAGITVAPEDGEAIASAVEELAGLSIEERQRMGSRARNYVEQHHDFTVLGERLESVLQSAVHAHVSDRRFRSVNALNSAEGD